MSNAMLFTRTIKLPTSGVMKAEESGGGLLPRWKTAVNRSFSSDCSKTHTFHKGCEFTNLS